MVCDSPRARLRRVARLHAPAGTAWFVIEEIGREGAAEKNNKGCFGGRGVCEDGLREV